MFRKKQSVTSSIQYILFGQVIPSNGFAVDDSAITKGLTYKTMKTQDLAKVRKEELSYIDDKVQYE